MEIGCVLQDGLGLGLGLRLGEKMCRIMSGAGTDLGENSAVFGTALSPHIIKAKRRALARIILRGHEHDGRHRCAHDRRADDGPDVPMVVPLGWRFWFLPKWILVGWQLDEHDRNR